MPTLLSLALIAQVLATPAPQRPAEDSEIRTVIERFRADDDNVGRIYSLQLSARRRERMSSLYRDTLERLKARNFAQLSFDGQVDYVLLRNDLQRRLRRLELQGKDQAKVAHLIPFASRITDLEEARRRMEPLDAQKAATEIDALAKQLKELRPKLGDSLKATKFEGNQAALAVRSLRDSLRQWYGFYNGYDPLFTWWVAEPYKALDQELVAYAGALKEKLVGVRADDENAIVGNPIGREALLADLQFAMIPYTPEELIGIAEREYAWCEAEMKKASRALGFGDDWKKALEHVKDLHVQPGQQPALIRELALEAVDFVEKRDLLTIPPLAKETWKMEMMSPERQLIAPFFLGGDDIIVSFPTSTMTHDQKRMSMRGNNRYFSRATVHHELIPGHHLQGHVNERNKPYRQLFYTPFWIEGWALYWEMLLWDQGFNRTPEEKIGALFWRMHRCVRIIFSLEFHLGKLTPEQSVDMLVNRVGHERANAEGEVRRSFNGMYEPLYQAAYMLGGLQIRALHGELVGTKKMTNRQFHDAILQENTMPIEMVRAILTRQKLSPDFATRWRFAG